jgi:ribosomal protein L22
MNQVKKEIKKLFILNKLRNKKLCKDISYDMQEKITFKTCYIFQRCCYHRKMKKGQLVETSNKHSPVTVMKLIVRMKKIAIFGLKQRMNHN